MRIGIIGAGQLGQMLAQAARPLGHTCQFLDPSNSPPAATEGLVLQADYDDVAAIRQLTEHCDVLTYEFENVPVKALATVPASVPVYPPVEALRCAQDRLAEKQLFEDLGIPLPGYRRVDTAADILAAGKDLGWPVVVKTRRLGYDGKGQHVQRGPDGCNDTFEQLGGGELIAEQWVPFNYEVSAIAARNPAGDIAHYGLTRNVHRDGILRESYAPLADEALINNGQNLLRRLLEHFDYVGTVALELFVVGDQLLANEYAPRVHNSGHWTIEGAACSQFENHIRAVCGQPLGSTTPRGYAGMVNLIGRISDATRHHPAGSMHDYGKSEREGRKLGHSTVVAESAAERDRLMADLAHSVT